MTELGGADPPRASERRRSPATAPGHAYESGTTPCRMPAARLPMEPHRGPAPQGPRPHHGTGPSRRPTSSARLDPLTDLVTLDARAGNAIPPDRGGWLRDQRAATPANGIAVGSAALSPSGCCHNPRRASSGRTPSPNQYASSRCG